MNIKLSLSVKLSLAVLLVAATFSIVLSIGVRLVVLPHLISLEKEVVKTSVHEQSHELEAIFNKSIDVSSTLSENEKIQGFMRDGSSGNIDEINSVLEYYNIGDKYLAIYVMDMAGKTLASTDSAFIGNNYGFRDYFQKAKEGAKHVDSAVGSTSGELGFYFSSPIEMEGEVIGVAVAKLNPQEVESSIIREDCSGQSRYFLFDEYGVNIVACEQSNLYKRIGSLEPEMLHEVENKKIYGDKELGSMGYDQILKDMDELHNVTSYEFANDSFEELVAVREVGNYGYYIGARYNLEELISTSERISLFAIIIASVFAMFCATILVFIVRDIMEPLNSLKKYIKSVGRGEYNQKLDLKRGDELGDLSREFVSMGDELKSREDKLQELNKNLEMKVQDRTKKLEDKLNEIQEMNKKMVGREIRIAELKQKLRKLEEKDK